MQSETLEQMTYFLWSLYKIQHNKAESPQLYFLKIIQLETLT